MKFDVCAKPTKAKKTTRFLIKKLRGLETNVIILNLLYKIYKQSYYSEFCKLSYYSEFSKLSYHSKLS